MNCDETLSVLATGGPLARRRARRHAARCSKCREAATFLDRISADLAPDTSLSPEQRAVWLGAADDFPAARPARRFSVRRIVAATAAVAASLAFVAFLATRKPEPPNPAHQVAVKPEIEPPDLTPTLRRLDAMRARLDDAEKELADLSLKAELLDVRQDADALFARFAPHDAKRTL